MGKVVIVSPSPANLEGVPASPDAVSSCCTPGLHEPLTRDDAQQLAGLLKAVADPVRLQLISIIAANYEVCACDLTAPVGLSQPTVSHHLKVLTDAGVILREKRGTWAWFRVNPDRIADLRRLFG